MAKRMVISDKCNGCGVCFSVCGCIEEDARGFAEPRNDGYYLPSEEDVVQQAVSLCPQKAISLVEIEHKTKKELFDEVYDALDRFKLPLPPKEALKMNKEEINIPIPIARGESQYIYNSSSKAMSAAKDEIDRLMYSQRANIVKNILIEYKTKVILKYFSTKRQGNYFDKALEEANKKMKEIVAKLQLSYPNVKIPDEFAVISVEKDKAYEYNLEYWDDYIQNYSAHVLNGLSDSVYSLKSYAGYCDWDDTEECAGTGLFGSTKYVTKYCYKDTESAFKEMANDLKGEIYYYISGELQERIKGLYEGLEAYNQRISQNMREQIRKIQEMLPEVE